MQTGVIANLLRQRIAGALNEARAVSPIPHPGLRGRYRELLVGRLIEPLLPPTCGIYKGTTVDSAGARLDSLSDEGRHRIEDDILVVDREALPPLLMSETVKDGIIPQESVLARIEVKSRLTAAEVRDAIDAAKFFKAMVNGLPPEDLVDGAPLRQVFAFDTDLELGGMSEFVRLAKYTAEADGYMDEPPIVALCVVGRGTWAHIAHQRRPAQKQWAYCPATPDHNEVLTFLGLLMNSLPPLRRKRAAARLGNHIVDPSDFVDVDP